MRKVKIFNSLNGCGGLLTAFGSGLWSEWLHFHRTKNIDSYALFTALKKTIAELITESHRKIILKANPLILRHVQKKSNVTCGIYVGKT